MGHGNRGFSSAEWFSFISVTHHGWRHNPASLSVRLRNKDVFPLIHRHNLFDSIQDKIVMLMEFHTKQAVELLIDNVTKVPVSKSGAEWGG